MPERPGAPSGPSGLALRRHERRVTAMVADPDLKGDLLLVGIGLARYVDLVGMQSQGNNFSTILDGYAPREISVWVWLRPVLRDDIRRYNALLDLGRDRFGSATCQAPMVRRDGACGRRASAMGSYRDLETGRAVPLDACSRTEHRAWWDRARRQHHLEQRQAEEAGTMPVPPANYGGVLARHFPEIAWDRLWATLDPRWKPAPEETPQQRPTLSVHINLDDLEESPTRPSALGLVPDLPTGTAVDLDDDGAAKPVQGLW